MLASQKGLYSMESRTVRFSLQNKKGYCGFFGGGRVNNFGRFLDILK
jgi:hypothetical protein